MRDSYTNPSKTKRIEYFGIFDLTKRIHETNLWKTGLRNESTIRIFGKPAYETNPRYKSLRFGFASPPAWIRKDSFRAIVLRIRKDSLDSWKQVESLENQSTKRIHETNLLKTLIRDPRYETNPDSSITKQNESFWSQDSWLRYETNPWIRETNPRFYESLIRIPHP